MPAAGNRSAPSLRGASPPQQLSDQSAASQPDVGDELGAAAAAFERDLAVVERLELRPMADADDRRCIELLRQQLHQLVLAFGVERRRGLVEHDDVGPMQQDAREREPLLLAAGQRLVPGGLLVEAIDQLAETDELQCLRDFIVALALRRLG